MPDLDAAPLDYSLEGTPYARADNFSFWARLTTASATVPSRYGWVAVQPDPGGATWVDDPDGISAGPDDPGAALEANGTTGIAAGNVVWLQPSPQTGGEGFAFRMGGVGSAGPGGSVGMATVNPGPGDTGVSLPAVTNIQIDQASGLQLASPGKVSAQNASATHNGVVNQTGQVFSGRKRFATRPLVVGATDFTDTDGQSIQCVENNAILELIAVDTAHATAGLQGYSAIFAREFVGGTGHLLTFYLHPTTGDVVFTTDLTLQLHLNDTGGAYTGQSGSYGGLQFKAGWLVGGSFTGASDHKVLVAADDTTPDFLLYKLQAGTGITLAEVTGGGGEKVVQITSSATGGLPETPLAVAHGGTGQVALTTHGVMLGEGGGAVGFAGPSTAGYVLTANGTSADPSFQALPAVPGDHKVLVSGTDTGPAAFLGAKLLAGGGITISGPGAGGNEEVVIAASPPVINAGGGGGAYVMAGVSQTINGTTYADVLDTANGNVPVQVVTPAAAGTYYIIVRVRCLFTSGTAANRMSARLYNVTAAAPVANSEACLRELPANVTNDGGQAVLYAWLTTTGSVTIRLQAKVSGGTGTINSNADGRTEMDYALWR